MIHFSSQQDDQGFAALFHSDEPEALGDFKEWCDLRDIPWTVGWDEDAPTFEQVWTARITDMTKAMLMKLTFGGSISG